MGVMFLKRKVVFTFASALSVAALMILMLSGDARAFHRGGVGSCDGCHIMHGSQGGYSNWLLPGTDPSSVCLNCHSGQGSSLSHNISSPDGSALTPGGDFYWINKSFVWIDGASPGYSHGHNIVAQDYGFTADVMNTSAPGGTYLSSDLACNSCHDPHGISGSGLPVSDSGSYGLIPDSGTALGKYRLLGGAAYDGGEHSQGYYFNNDAPVARQNPLSPYGETDNSHVDYGSGMSEWCANCHDSLLTGDHQTAGGSFEHPVGSGASLGDFINAYNSYIKTGDVTGLRATSYLALIPFERGVTDTALLDPASAMGPDGSSRIMCLTCHRAHASAFGFAGRWDFTAELIADSHPAAGDGGVSGSDVLNSYYDRDMTGEFGPDQRSLCEKCHDVPRDGYPPGW